MGDTLLAVVGGALVMGAALAPLIQELLTPPTKDDQEVSEEEL